MIQTREIQTIGGEYAPCLREVGEGQESRIIQGYGAVFERESIVIHDRLGKYIEVIKRGAITQEVIDAADIKMTLWHNREKLLARRNKGVGSLEVGVDEVGVWYRFEAPNTPDGNTALELVKRGDLRGASFTYYTREQGNVIYTKSDKGVVIRNVLSISNIYDMTIASDPAYKDTTVYAREVEQLFDIAGPTFQPQDARKREVAKLRKLANNL